MKIVKKQDAESLSYISTSSVLEYGMALNEKNMDFCINKITGRYPLSGYCSNLECEELCYVLEGSGSIYKVDSNPITFNKEDIIFINKGDIYYLDGNFKLAIVCTPAWSKEQCKLYSEEELKIG